MRILLTNDDGIDSVGLHVLARAMRPFGEVVIAAPDREFSGAGAALGATEHCSELGHGDTLRIRRDTHGAQTKSAAPEGAAPFKSGS